MTTTRLASFGILLALSALAAGCSTSTPAAPSDSSLSSNISGVWSGTAPIFGISTNITVNVSQATSTTTAAPTQAITGTVTLSGNPTVLTATGTKSGNDWSLSASVNDTIVTVRQTLTAAKASAGTFSLQVGPASNTGTVALNLVKS